MSYYDKFISDFGKIGVFKCVKSFNINGIDGYYTAELYAGSYYKYKVVGQNIIVSELEGSYSWDITAKSLVAKIGNIEKIDTLNGFSLTFNDRTYYYDKDLNRHRDDGPAIEDEDIQVYYKHGVIHREGAPASINRSYDVPLEEWYIDGRLHREDGPAVSGGHYEKPEYYLKGKKLSKRDFLSITKRSKKENISKDELLDLIMGLIDEYDRYTINYDKTTFSWSISLFGEPEIDILPELASLSSRLSDWGLLISKISKDEYALKIRIQ